MAPPAVESTFHELFYTIGYTLGEAESLVDSAQGSAAAGWLVSRVLRPRRVRWTRAVLAGVAGTVLGDVVAALERHRDEGAAPDDTPGAAPEGGAGVAPNAGARDVPGAAVRGAPVPARRPEPASADGFRYLSGIAAAAAYGAYIYPRLPGRPLTRGVAFAALELAAARSGGAFGLLRRLAPDIDFPLDSIVTPGLPAHRTLPTLAFGIALGLYRGKGESVGR